MDKLEKYMRSHAAEFDTEAPPEGHEGRFLAALGMTERRRFLRFARNDRKDARNDRKDARNDRKDALNDSITWMRWAMVAVAFAVVAAAVVMLPAGRRSFLGVGNDPQKVYLAYLDRVEAISRSLPQGDEYNWEGVLRGMTDEAVPMIEQLPEELSGRQQARILKQYYGDILAGVEQLKKAK